MKTKNKHTESINPHIVSEIVDHGLCLRCGACEPACPFDIIRFDEEAYPYITNEAACPVNCKRCLKICPGETVDFAALDKEMFGVSPHYQSVTGIVRRSLVTFSTDEQLRSTATSGGFTTQLLEYMMQRGYIDGALVLGSVSDEEGWREKAFIARSPTELRSAIKSKYRLVPYLRPLKEIEEVDGRYAVVGLPCHIHALKKYLKSTHKLKKRIVLTIGLYCNVAFEPKVYDELCEINGVQKKDIKHLDFRAGHWPGTILATLQDGTNTKVLKAEEMRDEFNLLKMFYAPERCNMCIDFSAEYADIAVGDPWLRGRPDGDFIFSDGRTGVITRTEIGDRMVQEAAEAGLIRVEEISIKTFMVNWERAARYKRAFVPQNIKILRRLGRKVPDYNRPLPKGTVIEFIQTFVKFFNYRLAKYKWYRMMGLRVFQTKAALAYFRWNRNKKAEKFIKALPKMERFFEAYGPPPPKSLQEPASRPIQPDSHVI
ncbi:Coenzyme F420 hydrogenase/dehydrogenase, beta subunit C-terminal domain [Gammaproteobacteria bacterium]|nr:Coenzyme F420 hydrogenase/dehydrogenase, beta subunit C-terminal domain [Gammaproteobacteria bacterium]